MATRFYLPSSGTAPVTPAFNLGSSWSDTTGADRMPMYTTKQSTAMTTETTAKSTTTANTDILVRQYISKPIAAQTITAGTVKGTIRVAESAANDNIDNVRMKIIVIDSSNNLRGTILARGSYGPTNEWATSLTNRRLADGDSTTQVIASNNDRIVIEIGFMNTASGTSISGDMRFGDASASDLADNETGTSDDNPFVELSNNITFMPDPLTPSVSDSVTVTDTLNPTDTFYFDTSDAAPSDPNGVWTDDANAFDGNTGTVALTSTTGSTSSNFLLGEGTNAPSSGAVITQVRVRGYSFSFDYVTRATIYTDGLGQSLGSFDMGGATGYTSYTTLTTPTGGWTWAKIQALEVKLHAIDTTSAARASRIEIEVSTTSIIRNLALSVNDAITVTDFITGGELLVDSYSESNQESAEGYAGNLFGFGQSFTGNGGTLSKVRLYLKKNGSPTDNLTVKVYAHSGTFGTSSIPTGSALATTDSPLNTSTLTTSYGLYDFTFSGAGAITLTNGTRYVVTAEYTTSNGINTPHVGSDHTSPTHSGNGSYLDNLGVWTADTTFDLCFYVYTSTTPLISIVTDTGVKTPSVNDVITATDVPTIIIPTLKPSVNDALTVTEDITTRANLHPAVSDQVTVTENISAQVILNISVFDSITVEDFPGYYPDQVWVTEDVKTRITSYISVHDSVSITENVTLVIPSLVPSVSDSITVTDVPTIRVNALPSVSDSVSITENIQLDVRLLPSANDSVTITEDVQLALTGNNLSVSVNDAISVTESVTIQIQVNPSVSDNVTVTDVSTILLPTLVPSVSDNVTVNESVNVQLVSHISVNDQVTITDVPTLQVVSYPSVNDVVTVIESVTVRVISHPSVFDSVSVSEQITLSVPLPVSVNDQITITENTDVKLTSYISVNDAITATDVPTIVIPVLFVSVNDSITVVDQPTVEVRVTPSVFDSVTITENVDLKLTSYVSVNDAVTVAENVQLEIVSYPSVSDSITVVDAPTVFIPTLYIAVNDSVSVLDVVQTGNTLVISVLDTITVDESVTLRIPTLFLSVNDAVTVSEAVSIKVNIETSVNDTVTVAEQTSLLIPTLFVSVNDSVTVTENVSFGTTDLAISVYDAVVVEENTSFLYRQLNVEVSDSVTITENIRAKGRGYRWNNNHHSQTYNNDSRHTESYSNTSRNSASYNNSSRNTASYSNGSRNTSTYTNDTRNEV